MAEVELTFSVLCPKEVAEIMVKSISPEIVSMRSERSKVSVELLQSGEIFVAVRSADLTASRAAANTVIRLLNTSLQTLEVLENVR